MLGIPLQEEINPFCRAYDDYAYDKVGNRGDLNDAARLENVPR